MASSMHCMDGDARSISADESSEHFVLRAVITQTQLDWLKRANEPAQFYRVLESSRVQWFRVFGSR